jgi:hypothetical protein
MCYFGVKKTEDVLSRSLFLAKDEMGR